MADNIDPEALFTQALVEGSTDAVTAWLEAGPETVQRLRRELTGEQRIVVPEGTPDRLLLDNLTWASHETARMFPEPFLAAFADDRWDENPFVCAGLGAIHRPETTERLMTILRTGSRWLRIGAAVALRGHEHPQLKEAFAAALDDPDEIVQYHASQRLAELSGQAADGEAHDEHHLGLIAAPIDGQEDDR